MDGEISAPEAWQASPTTLPVDDGDGLTLDLDQAHAFGLSRAAEYAAAQPFAHIVLDDFLPEAIASGILAHFPASRLPSDTVYELGYAGLHKRQVLPAECDRFSRDVFAFFNSAAVLRFLEGLSGISGLIPDPYFSGGGFHEIGRGGLLGIHADFRVSQTLNVRRRINLLIYLNPGWEADWGGNLELWDKQMKGAVRSVSPIFNRCVIFNTDARSFHGHPEPLTCPHSVTRKSIALYYYTASEKIHEDTPSLGTVYKSRPSDNLENRIEVAKLTVFNFLIRDWLPPVVFRGVRSLRRTLRPPAEP